MKKKIIVTGVLVSLLIVLISFSFSYQHFSADSTGTQLDINKVTQTKNQNPETIKVNYSKEQISDALDNKNETVYKSIIKQIVSQEEKITENTNSVSTEEIEGQELPKDNPVKDRVIILSDKKGQIVSTPQQANTKKLTGASIFNFDSTTPKDVKNYFIQNYPKIEKIYGPRIDQNKIKVKIDSTCSRSFALMTLNTVVLCTDGGYMPISEELVIHELTHIFHGRWVIPSPWEEGFAMLVTSLVRFNTSSGYKQYTTKFDSMNVPYEDYQRVQNANDGYSAYEWGLTVLHKLYIQDSGFIKKFNSKLYVKEPGRNSHQDCMQIVASIMSNIEHESVMAWFARLSPFLPTDQIDSVRITNDQIVAENLQISYDADDGAFPFSIKIYDYKNKLLAESKNINQLHPRALNKNDFESISPSFSSYMGLAKILVTYSGQNTSTQEIFLPCFKTSSDYLEYIQGVGLKRKYDIVGVVKNDVISVKITNKKTGVSNNYPVTNGMFLVDRSDNYSGIGTYIAVLNKIRSGTKGKIFNKPDSTYGMYYLRDDNLVPDVKCTRGNEIINSTSYKVNTQCDKVASQVMMFMNIPIARTYQKSSSFYVDNLTPKTNYYYSILLNLRTYMGVGFKTK